MIKAGFPMHIFKALLLFFYGSNFSRSRYPTGFERRGGLAHQQNNGSAGDPKGFHHFPQRKISFFLSDAGDILIYNAIGELNGKITAGKHTDKILAHYPDTVRVVFKHFPLTGMHPLALFINGKLQNSRSFSELQLVIDKELSHGK
jgi:hypothetical protein